MKVILVLLAVLALIASIFWGFKSEFTTESVVSSITSLSALVALIAYQRNHSPKAKSKINQEVSVNLNFNETKEKLEEKSENPTERDIKIDSMKPKLNILFIDDDKNFQVVKILKDNGWIRTKSVVDIKGMDVPIVRNADIYFVDINGVGSLLQCENEGLDLALMLTQKYPRKKVVIYSANKKNNVFHEAWDKCDKLEKNALPYQFQNIVEEYSLSNYP